MKAPRTGPFVFPEDMPLHELDRRYFSYADTLGSPLDTLARDRQLFAGGGESRQITSLREVYSLVTCLPWLFIEAFPAISEADLVDIAEAGTLLIMAAILNDHYVDDQLPSHLGIPLLHQRLYTAALQRFHALFEAQSPFWTHFENYLHQSTTALLREMRDHRGRITAYSIETMREIGSGKAALLKTMPTALALKAGAQADIPHLEAALDAAAAALQLGDDCEDWEEDYRHQKYTLPLTQVIPIEQWPTPRLSVEEIGQLLEKTVVLETLLKQVIEWLEQALHAVDHLHCPRWVEFVEYYVTFSRDYQRSLIVEKLRKTILGEPAEDN